MKGNKTDIQDKLEAGRDYKAPTLASEILKNNQLKDLVKIVVEHKDPVVNNRAMWILWHCSNIDYSKVTPYHKILIELLKREKNHSGVIRLILALFQTELPPIEYQSFLLDKCYSYLSNAAEPIAVRAFAMTVIFNISKSYPELLQELKTTLQHLPISEESAGIKVRIKNTLIAIDKITLTKNK